MRGRKIVAVVKTSDASVRRVGMREEGNPKGDLVHEKNSVDHLALLKQECIQMRLARL